MITAKVASAYKRDTVDATSLEYDEMAREWDIITDFLGTTRTLRELRVKWLPKMKKESADNYNRRIDLSYLYPMLRDTIAKIVSRPFSRDVQVKGELPERLAPMAVNADGCGGSLTQVGKRLFSDAAAYGLSHILTEFPALEREGETEADQAALGKAPFLTLIPATEMLGWRSDIGPDGRWRLTEIRWREQESVKRGTYTDEVREVIRVLRSDGTWERWSRPLTSNTTAAYRQDGSGTHSFPGIPLRTLYLDYVGPMMARPPLVDLAWLNQAHFRAMSRQLWHEEFLRTPVFLRTGWSAEELADGVDIGASEGIGSSNENAKAAWVEASGSAATIGREGIKALEERAEVLGHQHMVSRTGDVRATAVAVDEAKTDNNVQAWIRAAEVTLRQALEDAATFVGEELPEDVRVDIWSDFPLAARAGTDVPMIAQLRQARIIRHSTALEAIRLRGLLPSTLDVEAEVAALAAEGPPLGRLGLGDMDGLLGAANGAR